MEIKIKEKIAELEMDVDEFKDSMKNNIKILGAIRKSCKVIYNREKVSAEKLFLIIFGETNWSLFLGTLDDQRKVIFRIHIMEFKDRYDYISEERNADFSYVKLKLARKSGTGYLLINSLIRSPEAFIDAWLQKRLYSYVNSEFEKVIYDLGEVK